MDAIKKKMQALKINLESFEKEFNVKSTLLETTDSKYKFLTNENYELKNSLSHLEENIDIGEFKTLELHKQLKEVKIQIQEFKIETVRLHNAIDYMESLLKEKAEVLVNFRTKNNETKNKLSETTYEQKQIELEIGKLEEETEILEEENKTFTTEIEILSNSLKSLKVKGYFNNKNKAAITGIDKIFKCIEAQKNKNKTLVEKLQKLDTSLDKLISNLNIQDEEAKKAKEDLDSLVAELGLL